MCLGRTTERIPSSPGSEAERRVAWGQCKWVRALSFYQSLSWKPKEIRGNKTQLLIHLHFGFLLHVCQLELALCKTGESEKENETWRPDAWKATVAPWTDEEKPLADFVVLLSHCVRLKQCGLCVPAGNPLRSHPCTASSLCLSFAELTTVRYLRGVLAHAVRAGQLHPHQPVISGPQLLACLSVFASHKEFLVLSQDHKCHRKVLQLGPDWDIIMAEWHFCFLFSNRTNLY